MKTYKVTRIETIKEEVIVKAKNEEDAINMFYKANLDTKYRRELTQGSSPFFTDKDLQNYLKELYENNPNAKYSTEKYYEHRNNLNNLVFNIQPTYIVFQTII